jgi:hypothetical protein
MGSDTIPAALDAATEPRRVEPVEIEVVMEVDGEKVMGQTRGLSFNQPLNNHAKDRWTSFSYQRPCCSSLPTNAAN